MKRPRRTSEEYSTDFLKLLLTKEKGFIQSQISRKCNYVSDCFLSVRDSLLSKGLIKTEVRIHKGCPRVYYLLTEKGAEYLNAKRYEYTQVSVRMEE